MHATKLKSIVSQYGELMPDELLSALLKDDRKFTPEEVTEIQEAIKDKVTDVVKNGYDPKNPNADLDLSEFDYDNLTDASFEKYQKLIGGLNGFQNRDFVQYNAHGVFKNILNDNADKETVLKGIKIVNSKPINFTRIPVSAARDLNNQIYDRNNPHTNARYYLLKKPY